MDRASSEKNERLPLKAVIGLAAPNVSLSALALPLIIFLPEYYSSQIGMSMGVVGLVFMLVRLFDIGFDPLLGSIMDRRLTRFGRYRPWLVAGVPAIMLAIVMLFMPPASVGPIYLFAWLVIAYAGWSSISLAQLALVANVAPDYHERSRVSGWSQFAFFCGMIGVTLLPRAMGALGYGSPAQGMAIMACLVAVITPILVGFTLFAVPERVGPPVVRHSTLRDYLALAKDRTVQRLLVMEGTHGLAAGTAATTLIFFFTRIKELERADVGVALIATYVTGLIFTNVWARIARAIGKHRAFVIAMLGNAAAYTGLLFLPTHNLLAAMGGMAVVGIFFGAYAFLPRAMMADVSDEQRLLTGMEQTGVLFALLIGVYKIGQALCVGLIFYALQLVGFDPTHADHSSAQSLNWLAFFYVGCPVIASLIAALVALRYPITPERHSEIREQLKQIAARDRYTGTPDSPRAA